MSEIDLSKATPRPWAVDVFKQYPEPVDSDFFPVLQASCDLRGLYWANLRQQPEWSANAAMIVQAVNAFDDMRAALTAMLELIDLGGGDELARVHHPDMINSACDSARAALAKATVRP